ncbi:lytic murein transglycosylase [Salinispora cortesiana]|uniref:lytic murein transglycosylase n=1 Tax=Salinispora cortesiana TaxID=1305843 RepID=UPI000406B855|nr:lytic murein transglycosylase [Salinispora cortesiana]
MGNTRQVVDGEQNQTLRPLRPATPGGGAQSGSDVAAGRRPGPVPRPRRPWLQPPTAPDAKPAPDPNAKPTPDPNAKPTRDPDAKPTPDPNAKPTPDPDAKPVDEAEPADSGDADLADEVESSGDPAGPERAARVRRRRSPFAHAIRVSPSRLAVGAARSVHRWSRRPSGQLTLPGGFLLLLVAATVAAGALLVPATVRSGPNIAAATAGDTAAPTSVPDGPPAGILPPPDATLTAPPPGLGRPADTLASWAAQTAPKVDIAPVALQAYGYAELVLAQTNRSCGLSWTTLAAIGHVESAHGQANNARLGSDGRAAPEIIGLPLDGQGGRMLIRDTDRGTLDQDATYDRAIGPMQFIPTTWQEIGADADNDGRKDPHDIDDAALAAANYLCKGGRNLTIAADWWNAILSYNDVRQYAQDVFDKANQYGQASRS